MSTITLADFESTETTPLETLVSLLVALLNSILAFLKSLSAKPDYLPRLYYPTEPAYFTAKKRDPKDIITNTLTQEQRDQQGSGELRHSDEQPTLGPYSSGNSPVKPSRKTEIASIRSFVESRCPTLLKGTLPLFWALVVSCAAYQLHSVSTRLCSLMVATKVRLCQGTCSFDAFPKFVICILVAI